MTGLHNGPETQVGIHWRSPVVMVTSLIVGTALAVGHHTFYASLAGSAVSSDPIKVVGWTTTQQQVNIAIGTAFAFVIKASLILACSTAYMQLLFGAINRASFKLSTLDNWFSGLNDIWSLGCLASYWRYPMLTLGALTCWLLPIAAIISPASLSVVFDQVHPPPVLSVSVPQPAIYSLALADWGLVDLGGGSPYLNHNGPAAEVSRIAFAAASSGTILPIDPPGKNASWELEFTAPRYTCGPLEPGKVDQVIRNLMEVLDIYTRNGTWSQQELFMYDYLSWSALSKSTSQMPFVNQSTGWELRARGGDYFKGTGVDLFVAIIPRQKNVWLIPRDPGFPLNRTDVREDEPGKAEDKLTLMKWYFETATILRCNSTPTAYRLEFSYSGSQEQHVRILSAADADDFQSLTSSLYPTISDDGLLTLHGEGETDVQNITSWASSILRLGSYAALQEATNALIVGASTGRVQGRQLGFELAPWSLPTRVFSTVLARTAEMQALNYGVSTARNVTLQESGMGRDQAQSLLAQNFSQPELPFGKAVEELLFNITVSMASSSSLTYNSSSPLAPPPTNVTLHVFGNVYSYGSDKLWLAYGIAIGVTFLNVLVGLWAIFQTGASYTDNFSTVIRVGKNAVIEADMWEISLPGKDPLPKSLAKAELRLLEGEDLLESKQQHDSVESIHNVVGYAPPRVDSRGWKLL